MSQKFSLANFFGIDEDDADSEVKASSTRNDKVVSIDRPTPEASKVIIFQPQNYADVDMIAQKLLDNSAVIIKVDKLDVRTSSRMVDFLNGVLFAINGKINRLDKNIFICTPANFRVTK